MAKYNGELADLKASLEEHGFTGTWAELPSGTGNKFTANGGGYLTLFHNKTMQVQGNAQAQKKLETFISTLTDKPVSKLVYYAEEAKPAKAEAQVFVVYGHDDHSREQLEHILLKIGIKPFVLGNTTGGGLTIIEALEKQVGVDGSATAGIVLLTPDDMGYSLKAGAEAVQPRARQNVVLEMGMLLGKLGRTNTTILIKGQIEHPSDIQGIIYLQYKDHIKEIAVRLIKRLRECGFEIDAEKAMEALN